MYSFCVNADIWWKVQYEKSWLPKSQKFPHAIVYDWNVNTGGIQL